VEQLWQSASYEPHLLSLLFAFAPAAMMIVIAYAFVMRGATVLRAWLFVHFVSLLPYAVAVTLSPSMSSRAAAEDLFRLAGACIPMSAAAGAGFQFALLGWPPRARTFVWVALALAAAWIVPTMATDVAVVGVRRIGGLWYADAGRLAWLELVTTFAISLPGFIALAAVALRGSPSHERRQLRLVLAANLITYAGLSDVALAYGIGVFPLGWLLSGIGSLLVVRALVVEDLLRARAFDTTAPRLVLHLAAAIVLGWLMLGLLGPGLPWWNATLALAISFASVRTTIAMIALVNRGARTRQGTLDRLVNQLVARTREARGEAEVAHLAVDIIELGVGVRTDVLVAAAEDGGWTRCDSSRVDDDSAPDPLLVGWLSEQPGARFPDEVAHAPEGVRAMLARLFDRHHARAILPVASRDELLALVIVPANSAPARGRGLAFLEHVADRLADALVHVRLAKRAAERAALAREVELAATVQQRLLPGAGPHVHGELTVIGSWLPATRCAGDFWALYPLGQRRLLVIIGDVTGHGVAPAAVTSAAAAACQVVVRRDAAAVELARLAEVLDAAVRRIGGGHLQMTCFASILDLDASEIRFMSCGHPSPYLCRPGDAGVDLQVLVGRGNPLGGATPVAPKIGSRPLRAGDLVVWYTDGVIDAQDPTGQAFGDRRLQRMLRRLERVDLAADAVHDVVHAAVAAHRGDAPRHDDETLVVAEWPAPGQRSASATKEAGA
jgi:serine phosphatase RsbU (regulator of sigma subunit)